MNKDVMEKYLPKSKRVRMLVLMAIDVCAVCLASFFGLFIRFDMNVKSIPAEYTQAAEHYLPLYVIGTLFVFLLFKLYATMWSARQPARRCILSRPAPYHQGFRLLE